MENSSIQSPVAGFTVRSAAPSDIPLILSFIRELAEYEKLLDTVVATEEKLRSTLFSERPAAEVVIGEYQPAGGKRMPAGFALFFHNYSTFLAQPGLYLEDLYVRPEFRGLGIGKVLLSYLAKVAIERKCGRLEWSVLDWNVPAIGFYQKLGAVPMDDWTVQRLTGEALEALASSSKFSQSKE